MWKHVFLCLCNVIFCHQVLCQKLKLLKIHRIQPPVSVCKQNVGSFIVYVKAAMESHSIEMQT